MNYEAIITEFIKVVHFCKQHEAKKMYKALSLVWLKGRELGYEI